MRIRPRSDGVPVEPFGLDDWWGELNRQREPVDLATTVDLLVDPANATETLYWGRNYLYSAEVTTADGPVEVAVKQFRNQGLGRRLERRIKGSKADRSWRGALAVLAAGVATPEPVLLIESRQPEGPSFFVTRRLTGFVEARYYFRALQAGTEKTDYPEVDADRLIEQIGGTIRQLHEGGVWHRDLSIGNLLLQADAGNMTINIIDLNRSRTGGDLSVSQRTRDLCRLRIFRAEHQEILLRSYWQGRMKGFGFKRWLYRCYFYGFLFKVRLKGVVRAPFKWLGGWVPRKPHAHIPAAPSDADKRDRAVWDGLSDQPHQHAGRIERLSVRLADTRHHLREMGAALGALPRVWHRYVELSNNLYSKPTILTGFGIAIRPWPDDPEGLLGALDLLGVKKVLLRLHPWQESHEDELALASELSRRGFELAFSLPQNRELVKDRERWRASITKISELFAGLGRHFQIGQAINRSKWGVWNVDEYLDLAADAGAVLRQTDGVELMGPAVIDYELYRTAGIVNLRREGVVFDILSSLLYVDRRGAPENRQLGFDTVDKVLQVKAIADTARSCGGRSWITEVNWPLWEGPHSPAGKTVSVDEETQADYLARYYLLALGTGATERVYWWQVIARGYGLMFAEADGALVRRPSFHALATLHNQLEEATFLGPIKSKEEARLYHFRSATGDPLVVAWTSDNRSATVELPAAVTRQLDRDGREHSTPDGNRVRIDGSPRYFWLETD